MNSISQMHLITTTVLENGSGWAAAPDGTSVFIPRGVVMARQLKDGDTMIAEVAQDERYTYPRVERVVGGGHAAPEVTSDVREDIRRLQALVARLCADVEALRAGAPAPKVRKPHNKKDRAFNGTRRTENNLVKVFNPSTRNDVIDVAATVAGLGISVHALVAGKWSNGSVEQKAKAAALADGSVKVRGRLATASEWIAANPA